MDRGMVILLGGGLELNAPKGNDVRRLIHELLHRAPIVHIIHKFRATGVHRQPTTEPFHADGDKPEVLMLGRAEVTGGVERHLLQCNAMR